MTSLLHSEDPLDPGDHLVRAGVGGLVETNEARLDIFLDLPLEWRGAVWQRCVVVSSDVKFVEIF